MTYRVPTDLAWTLEAEHEDVATLYLAPLPNGPISVLRGTAALIWLAATEGPHRTLVERVAAEAGSSVSQVEAEVEAFLAELAGADLLDQAPDTEGP